MVEMMRTGKFLGVLTAMAFTLGLSACGGSSDNSGSATTDPIAFSASSYSIAQNAGSVAVTVTRTGSVATAVSVDYATVDGTAVAGSDYTATTGTLQWAENDSAAKMIAVPISDMTPFAGNKTFSIALSNPSSNAHIASPDTTVVTISGNAVEAPGDLQLSAATYAVTQSTGTLTVTVNRTGGSSGAVSVSYATTGGTAASGTDFTAASGSLMWADGDAASKTFSIAISNATPFSGSKSFSVALSSPGGGATLGSPSSATVTINGDASAAVGSLRLSASSYTVAQNTGTLTVTVNRTGGSNGAVSVSYATTGGTAVSGTDFTAASGSLTWADGDATAKTFAVAISNGTPFSGSKSFSVALSGPSDGATIGSPGTASVTINGDAAAAVGKLQFSASTYTVAQSGGKVTVTVVRTDGSSGAVSVSYATTGGTAVSGTDFTAASGSLTWADGDATSKTFAVAISNATPFSGSKSFSVTLSGAGGGATIGSPGTVSVTINGDAVAAVGTLQLSASTYAVAQTGGTVTVTVDRTGGSSGAVSVSYATTGGTAVSGTDFTAASGSLTWAAGDATPKTVSVAVSNATPFSGSRSFTIQLSNPTGGATLGSTSLATVTISGSSSASAGSLEFSAAGYTVSQSAGTATIVVDRTGGSNGAASVAYATVNGTAIAGTDYTAASGTLQWASGDASTKNFTVAISNATPFSGTKAFTIALSNASGAAITGPADASVSITGLSGGPSAVTNLLLTGQGANSESLAWTAATPGANPIASYNIYRNGSLYATRITGTTYTDNAATNATTPGYGPQPYIPATVYRYAVSAVDTKGNEGPQQTSYIAWVYHNGADYWTTSVNSYNGGITVNTADTSGQPQNGAPTDVKITVGGGANWWQPFSGAPFLSTNPSTWAMELGSFNYMTIDLKPTLPNQTWRLNIVSRITSGDNYNSGQVILGAGQFGPVAQVGKWATYKIPFLTPGFADGTSLQMGFGKYVGSISNGVLTVTEMISGMNVQGSSFLSGTGIVEGTASSTGTFLGSTDGTSGGLGTYPVVPSQNVASTTITAQRTNMYKFGLIDPSGTAGNVYYVDNIGFTTD